MSTPGTLTVWSELACRDGVELGALHAFDATTPPTLRRTRTGNDVLSFAVAEDDPYSDYLLPQRVLRLTDPAGQWTEWRVESETTEDVASGGERSFTAKPILMDLHDGTVCYDWTGPDPDSIAGGMASATLAEFWDTICVPSLALFGIDDWDLGAIDEPGRVYDFAYDGTSPFASILAAVGGVDGGRKRLRGRANGTTGYLLDVKSRLSAAAPLIVQPNRNLSRYNRSWSAERQATHIAVRGPLGTGTAAHTFRVSAASAPALTLVDPEGQVDPVAFANQLTAKYLRRLATGRSLPITTCDPVADTVTLGRWPGSGFHADPVDGELVEIRASAPDDSAPDPVRRVLLARTIRNGSGGAQTSRALDWRLASLNTVARTAQIVPADYVAFDGLTGATLADSLPLPTAPDLQSAALPADLLVQTLTPVYVVANARWRLAGAGPTYVFDGVTECGTLGYCTGALPAGITVGDVVQFTTDASGTITAVQLTSISADRTTIGVAALYPNLALPFLGGQRFRDVAVYRPTPAWVRLESFTRATNTATFSDGFDAAVAAGAIANGMPIAFARNSIGRGVTTLSDPTSEALYGTVVRTVDAPRVPGVRNYLPDGLFRDWPVGAPVPHGWSTAGVAPSRSTDPLYRPLGDAVILFDHGGSTILSSTVTSRVIRWWLPDAVTEVSLRVPYYLTGPAPATAPSVVVSLVDVTHGTPGASLAGYAVEANALKYDIGDHILLRHIPISVLSRDVVVQIQVGQLGTCQLAIRGAQLTATGEPPGGYPAPTDNGATSASHSSSAQSASGTDAWPTVADGAAELIEYSGSNTNWGAALDTLAVHADPRVTAATYTLGITDLFRTNPTAFPGDALEVDRLIHVQDARVSAPLVELAIVELLFNLRDPRDTEITVGLPADEAADAVASVSTPSSALR